MEERSMKLKLEFGGGAESMFGMVRSMSVSLPASGQQVTLCDLLHYMGDKLTTDKPMFDIFFGQDHKTVSSGLLILINDVDWELSNGLDTQLNDGDLVTFISALHGG